MKWYNKATREWQKFGGRITVPPAGAKSFIPVLVYPSHGAETKGCIEVRGLKLNIR